jgi:hypothetical protein
VCDVMHGCIFFLCEQRMVVCDMKRTVSMISCVYVRDCCNDVVVVLSLYVLCACIWSYYYIVLSVYGVLAFLCFFSLRRCNTVRRSWIRLLRVVLDPLLWCGFVTKASVRTLKQSCSIYCACRHGFPKAKGSWMGPSG